MGKKESNPDLVELVARSLKAGGYDGLYSESECGCLLDDLAPCGEPWAGCRAGYKQPHDCIGNDGSADFYVGDEKRKD